MDADQPLSAAEEKLLAELLERHQATGGRGGKVRDLRGLPWAVIWDAAAPGWAGFYHQATPGYLIVRVRTALTPDGVAAEAVLIERTDGRALTAQDLRKARLPQPWMLARGREFAGPGGAATVTAAKPGAHGKGDDHWRSVLRLLAEAERVAPRTPTKWMREQWPYPVSDPTMRRWIARARERAVSLEQAEEKRS